LNTNQDESENELNVSNFNNNKVATIDLLKIKSLNFHELSQNIKDFEKNLR
jgi:hypothetical protein